MAKTPLQPLRTDLALCALEERPFAGDAEVSTASFTVSATRTRAWGDFCRALGLSSAPVLFCVQSVVVRVPAN
eukprot:3449034-Pleurochrysis_carterae.AAC.4